MAKDTLTDEQIIAKQQAIRQRTVSWSDEGQSEDGGPRRGSVVHSYFEDDDEDDNASVTSLPAELPQPPDGGYGWVIVFVSFLANMVVDGIAYSFSPFLDVFSEAFEEPKGKVAWVSSLLAGVYLSAGPIVSALSNKYGCRKVCMVGGVLAAFAYGITPFANSVEYLMITQGVLGGLGFGLIYLPAVVAVGYYFESKRALATGIAVCGSGVGTMICPPLVSLMIANFGWKGTNIIIAGIILNCCVCGAMMRPLEVPRMKKRDLLHRIAEEKANAMEISSLSGSGYITVQNSDGTTSKQPNPKKPYNPDPGVHSHLNLSGYLTPAATSLALPTIEENQGNTPPDQESPIAEAAQDHDKKSSTSEATAQTQDNKSDATPDTPNTDDFDSSHVTDESKSLVNGQSKSSSATRIIPMNKVPRNMSQPAFGIGSRIIPNNGSVPNFDRRMSSKLELASALKVVPATDKASSGNLRGLGSQELRRVSSGYGRVSSAASFSPADQESGLRRRRSSAQSSSMMLRPMSRQDIFYSGSIANLKEYKSQQSMLAYRESTLNLQGTGASQQVIDAMDMPDGTKESGCCPESMVGTLQQMMDFSLMKNPAFLLIGIANLFGMLGFYTPFVYLPAAAEAKGVDKTAATFLVSIIGITNTVGRVLSGLVADIPCVSALMVNNVCIVASGLCVFLTPFATTYGSFCTISVFFGFFVSAYISLTSIILVDLLGLDQLTNAFGLLILFRGSASMVGPPLAGSIYDATQSYDVSFYVAGCLLFICAGLHLSLPFVQRCCAKDNIPVKYTTNLDYMQADPYLGTVDEEEEGPIVYEREGLGIILDVKPKDTEVVVTDSGEKITIIEKEDNEKEADQISAL